VRLMQGLVVIWLVSIVTFGMMHLVPGDPIDVMVGEAQITPEQLAALRAQWGLDQPVHVQYLTWIKNMTTGNMGKSVVRPGVPVSTMMAEAATVTIKVNLIAFIASILIAIPAGILAAVKRDSPVDYSIMVASSLGVALPNFWVGLMLIVLFSLKLQVLPPFGLMTWQGYVLPVLVLATEQTALIGRMMRSATLEILGQDYVRTARAKGLSERIVLLRHVARNAMLPVVTILGYRLAFVLSGTIIVETVFALPGLGRLFVSSINLLDYQVVQAIVLLLSIVVILGNLLTDLAYSLVDPRIRFR
jgi:ABC-type dipeptide/oligopeptide/nickel transport system permease component